MALDYRANVGLIGFLGTTPIDVREGYVGDGTLELCISTVGFARLYAYHTARYRFLTVFGVFLSSSVRSVGTTIHDGRMS